MTPRRFASLLLALALAMAGSALLAPTATAAPSYPAVDRDCGDFATQAAAQAFFLANGGPSSDPHGLDAEGDGIACETNPCPCSYDTSTGGSGSGGESTGSSSSGSKDSTKKTIRQGARVIRVVDGDTVKVRLLGGGRRTVRVIGIDTPEVFGGVECGGPEASESAKQLLPKGTRLTLTSDPTQAYKDAYGRDLRYITKGKKDIGKTQIRRGWAEVYVFNNKPFQRTKKYRNVQADAKAAARGIWGAC